MVTLLRRDLARTSGAWLGLDSPELYQKNLALRGSTWDWAGRNIHYQLNSQGYRCPEFDMIDWAASTVIIGCSYVMGIGLDEDQTVSAQLSQLTGKPVINLGQDGVGPMWQWATLSRLLSQVTPHRVIMAWSHPARVCEFLGWDRWRNWGAWNVEETHAWAPGWILHPDQATETLRYFRASSRLARPDLVEFSYWGTVASMMSIPWTGNPIDQARDCEHPGPATQARVAQQLAQLLNP